MPLYLQRTSGRWAVDETTTAREGLSASTSSAHAPPDISPFPETPNVPKSEVYGLKPTRVSCLRVLFGSSARMHSV